MSDASDPVDRSTLDAPSASPVPIVALQQQRALPPSPEELAHRRRRLVRVALALLVLAVVTGAVLIALLRAPSPRAAPFENATDDDAWWQGGASPGDDVATSRRALVAAHGEQIPLVAVVPDAVDILLAGQTTFRRERFSENDGVRIFSAVVDLRRVNAMLCERVTAEYQPSVAVAVLEVGPRNSDIATRLASSFAALCIRATVVPMLVTDAELPRDRVLQAARLLGAQWVIEGVVDNRDDTDVPLHGGLELHDTSTDQQVEMVSAMSHAGVDGAVTAWRDTFTKIIASRWSRQAITIKVKDVDDARFAALNDVVARIPYVASVRSTDLDANDVAKIEVSSFADYTTLARELGKADVKGRRVKLTDTSPVFLGGALVDATDATDAAKR